MVGTEHQPEPMKANRDEFIIFSNVRGDSPKNRTARGALRNRLPFLAAFAHLSSSSLSSSLLIATSLLCSRSTIDRGQGQLCAVHRSRTQGESRWPPPSPRKKPQPPRRRHFEPTGISQRAPSGSRDPTKTVTGETVPEAIYSRFPGRVGAEQPTATERPSGMQIHLPPSLNSAILKI